MKNLRSLRYNGYFQQICTVRAGFHLPERLGITQSHTECRRRCDIQFRREPAADGFDGIRQDGSGFLSDTDSFFGRYAVICGSCIHRAAKGTYQRSVQPPCTALRRSGYTRLALARRCRSVPQEQDAPFAVRDIADNAGIARSHAPAETRPYPEAVR